MQMTEITKDAIKILEKLVSFETISRRPTHGIVGYISQYLAEHGIEAVLSYDDDGERANVFATIGPEVDGGVVLNGHTDVVPVEGQDWATEPFVLTQIDDRLYGRGSVDMKGFLACALACVPHFKSTDLKKPIHLAFTYDEEVGGHGMPVFLKALAGEAFRPEIVIVGEPTEMQLVTGHKGGYEMRTEIVGHAVHSCDPTVGVNAISAATKMIAKIEEIGARLAAKPYPDSPYHPPHCTLNVGIIEGGTAANATAGWCNFNWEFRPMPGENGRAYIAELEEYAARELLPAMKAVHAESDIRIIAEAEVPALDERNAAKAAAFVSELTGLNSQDVVSFGTDAGYFSDDGLSTVVFGPGSISRAHKADEYIEISELEQGTNFLMKMAKRLSA